MKKHWWKILSVLILIYVFTLGLIAPLSTGIVVVTPERATAGTEATFEIQGYNSNFKKGEASLKVWLSIDSAHAICAKTLEILDEVKMKATFEIPNKLPINDAVVPATVVVNSKEDGIAVFPDAVFIAADTGATKASTNWTTCSIVNLYEAEKFDFPFRNLLIESIRNTYFHVPLWFGMIIIFTVSVVHSVRYLKRKDPIADIKAASYVNVGILYGILGLLTGGVWASYTWGEFWSFDIKQNMSAIALLIYAAYFVLRSSFEDEQQKARLGAIYNIFAFATLIPLLFIIPRLYDSLHPGNGGNPAFGGEDLDNTMRMVFYPAIIGWTLLGVWIATLLIRIETLKLKWLERE